MRPAKSLRSERRRRTRELQAALMNSRDDHAQPNLEQVAPLLDDAINRLGNADRTAILLRFFEQRDFRSVGQALGSNEDAARKRVNRALDKLQVMLRRRGLALSASALGAVLADKAVIAAPAGLASSVAGSVLASSSRRQWHFRNRYQTLSGLSYDKTQGGSPGRPPGGGHCDLGSGLLPGPAPAARAGGVVAAAG